MNLNLRSSILLGKIVKKTNAIEELPKIFTKSKENENIGIEIINFIIDNIESAEEEILEFLSVAFRKDVEILRETDISEIFEMFKEISASKIFKSFFQKAVPLVE